jgi:hypothetical protein
MARHIEYEIGMCVYAASVIAQFQTDSDQRSKMLMFEGFLIHFRNVMEFFWGKNDKAAVDRARATDYVSPVYWKPTTPSWYSENSRRCNKLLSHPSYDRIGYTEAGTIDWRFNEELGDLQREWSKFIQALPPERQKWFGHPATTYKFKTQSFTAGSSVITVHSLALEFGGLKSGDDPKPLNITSIDPDDKCST